MAKTTGGQIVPHLPYLTFEIVINNGGVIGSVPPGSLNLKTKYCYLSLWKK